MNTATSAPTTPALIHAFEHAGLGLAPYHYLGCTTHHTACQFCNTPITYLFWLESADHKIFYVGSDCIEKSGDEGLVDKIKADVAKQQKEVRHARELAYIAQFEALLAARPDFWTATYPGPHPYADYRGYGTGSANPYFNKTAGDFKAQEWQRFSKWRQTDKAKAARLHLLAAGETLPKAKRSRPDANQPPPQPTVAILAVATEAGRTRWNTIA